MRVAALCATSDENVSRERPAHTANAANPSPPNGEETPFARERDRRGATHYPLLTQPAPLRSRRIGAPAFVTARASRRYSRAPMVRGTQRLSRLPRLDIETQKCCFRPPVARIRLRSGLALVLGFSGRCVCPYLGGSGPGREPEATIPRTAAPMIGTITMRPATSRPSRQSCRTDFDAPST
jgi:hypothetical protein